MNQEIKATVVPCNGVPGQGWYAWINLMPPRPDDFHVTGEVQVPNPGVRAHLVRRNSPGADQSVLLLDLLLLQSAGVWPDILVWEPVRYDRTGGPLPWKRVVVYCGEDVLAEMEVEVVG